MLNSLKQAGVNAGREFGRAWGRLSKGWRELLEHGGDTPVRISRTKKPDGGEPVIFSRWSFPVDEVEETDNEIVVRVALPDMEKDDCHVAIEGNVLYLSGEKQSENEVYGGSYHVMERAYGAFQHAIPLPHNVDADRARAVYKNGVLSIFLPKYVGERERTILIS